MDELGKRAQSLGTRLGPDWNHQDVEAFLARLHRRVQARARRRVAAGVGLTVVAGTAALVLWLRGPDMTGSDITAPALTARVSELSRAPEPVPGLHPAAKAPLRFDDGSEVILLQPDTDLVAAAVSPQAVTLRLNAGAARFAVTPVQSRRFRVDAGEVAIEVPVDERDTAFAVTRREDTVAVEVTRGQARVYWPDGERVVHAGEERAFPPVQRREHPTDPALERAPHPGPSQVRERAPNPGPNPVGERAPNPAEREFKPVRDHTGEGVIEHAAPEPPSRSTRPRRLVKNQHPRPPSPDSAAAETPDTAALTASASGRGNSPDAATNVEALLLEADVARLSGRPEDAVPLLRQALALGTSPTREAIAAFTLGRVLIDELDEPEQAAEAFGRARRVAPHGPLAEDALAREVESWSRAGATQLARQRAAEYLDRYPEGRRLRLVRRFGDLD